MNPCYRDAARVCTDEEVAETEAALAEMAAPRDAESADDVRD